VKTLKVWFPEFFTEAHRAFAEGEILVQELERFGIECTLTMSETCDFILCGSLWKLHLVLEAARHFPDTPLIHYNWDLYPFQILDLPVYRSQGKKYDPLWGRYLDSLRTCKEIWVPSECTVSRTKEFVGRNALVIKTSVRPWEASRVSDQGYGLDVMRKYPDPNNNLPWECGTVVGVPIIESKTSLPWDEYKQTVADARFLVSGKFEASTGGLSLLEGYWHGKPVLLSDSPRCGAIDYFGNRATYFKWDNPFLLQKALLKLHNDPPKVDIGEARAWITEKYSERAMAQRMATRFWELYNG
jgi:hypothetical protein